MNVHIYIAESQPLTCWRDPCAPRRARRHRNNPRKCALCGTCGRRRWARDLRIQVYYDLLRIFCAEGCRRQK